MIRNAEVSSPLMGEDEGEGETAQTPAASCGRQVGDPTATNIVKAGVVIVEHFFAWYDGANNVRH